MAQTILKTMTEAGIFLRLDGNTLKASGRISDEFRQLIREHRAELIEALAANDPSPAFLRWRINTGDGRVFEVDTWPLATLDEIQATYPDATIEAVPEAGGGDLTPADESLIRAVLNAWEATPDEVRDALAEAVANPALMANWRRDAERLGLIEPYTKPYTKPHR